ncbi:MAG TPA: dolichyl-phosphate beta-glucosyltransferase [Candidatus Saccharimonadales bacterium]|nr:dolichyl-phosphate beta-glucosyltransferase [Candidatus Saccharimonadales bacterium]
MIKLSVIVPCYNEEKRFHGGFDHYYSFLTKQKHSWELIFVNDGSKDKTLKLMKEKSKGKKNIRILSLKANRGKGAAIVEGIKAAKGQIVLFTDLDHSVPIKTVESFFKYFEKGEKVVIGSRRIKGSKILVHQPILRETLGRGFTFLVNVLIKWGIKDSTCGFKAFENKTAQKIFDKITVYDWAFDAEIIFIASKLGINVHQAPVAWSDVSGSQVRLKKDLARSLFGLFKIRLNDLQGKYS